MRTLSTTTLIQIIWQSTGVKMIINGQKLDKKELKFTDFLKEKGFKMEFIALELNGEIVPRSEFESLILKENDKAEIVNCVGGG